MHISYLLLSNNRLGVNEMKCKSFEREIFHSDCLRVNSAVSSHVAMKVKVKAKAFISMVPRWGWFEMSSWVITEHSHFVVKGKVIGLLIRQTYHRPWNSIQNCATIPLRLSMQRGSMNFPISHLWFTAHLRKWWVEDERKLCKRASDLLTSAKDAHLILLSRLYFEFPKKRHDRALFAHFFLGRSTPKRVKPVYACSYRTHIVAVVVDNNDNQQK